MSVRVLKIGLLFSFFVFNCYRLGIGIEAEYGCTEGLQRTTTIKVANDVIEGNSTLKSYVVFAVDSETNETTLIGKHTFTCMPTL